MQIKSLKSYNYNNQFIIKSTNKREAIKKTLNILTQLNFKFKHPKFLNLISKNLKFTSKFNNSYNPKLS
jgi:hypothetical protein